MGKIITVMPTQQGAGGRYVATNLAYGLRLKNDSRIKIALVDFNFEHPTLALSLISQVSAANDARGIDSLLEKINSRTLNDQMFVDNMITIDGWFDVLRGTKMTNAVSEFNNEHIRIIMDYLRKIYDYTIISVAPNSYNAGTVFGIALSDTVVLVTRPNYEGYANFPDAVNLIKTYKNSDSKIKVIYNYRTIERDLDFRPLFEDNKDLLEIVGDFKFLENTVDNQNIKIGLAGKINRFGGNDFNKKIEGIIDKLNI